MSSTIKEKFFLLKDVRVSFPHLFEKPEINGQTGKCGAKFLLDPKNPNHKKHLKEITAHIKMLVQKHFKGSLAAEKRCLRKGSDTDRPEYNDYYVLSSNHKTFPIVLASDGKTRITEKERCAIYSGCRVNGKITIWVQNNKWGKRINANLVAIQFCGNDEPLDASYIDPETAAEGFESMESEDDSFDSFDMEEGDEDDILNGDGDEDEHEHLFDDDIAF